MLGLMGQRVSASGVHINGIDPSTGYWGDKVRIYGVGATPDGLVLAMLNRSDTPVYMANRTVPMIDNSPNVTLGWTAAQASGDWEIFFAVPLAAPKTYTIFVEDNESSTSDESSLSILTKPIPPFEIDTITPSSGKPGTQVQVYGFGCCYEGLRVYFDDTLVAALTGGVYSGWNTAFTVPSVLPGNYTVTLVDVLSGGNLTKQFTVQLFSVLHTSPTVGAIGTRLMIYGEDFPAEKTLYITFEDSCLATAYVNETGMFDITVFVPVVNSGDYTIKANYPINTNGEWETLASAQFSVTEGVDTYNQRIEEINSTLSQVQANMQSILSMQDTVRETQLVALIAMILSGTTVIILVATLFRQRRTSKRDRSTNS
jgi:hypothetical protein